MINTIENQFLKISSSTHGGELHSILSKIDGTEFLWNGDETFWKYHAPILFPIVGKVNNNEYSVDGVKYTLPQHGLARVKDFELIEKSENSFTYELKYSEETLKVFPFKFSLKIIYSLFENTLNIKYVVTNADSKDMLFSIGAHPAFMCPLYDNETMNDYYFEFSENETCSLMPLNSNGFFKREQIPFLENEKIIPLSKELFKNDALVLKNLNSEVISLKSKNHSKSLDFNFSEFPYLGLWSKPSGAPFVCIEPWLGHSDFEDFTGDFSQKEGILKLAEKETFSCNYSVKFNV
ncbi:aldose 1-epimerase family protein [Clostridium fungisolvens]|uniref:Protein LacX, plasmid n=1 Tax=Clostridium fungisolvens TaxID=1604897 RepID=A0A6V8S9P7_9CLOT|nr:aldose 1-epimerase family protein [Clostridium fungisolvens]GFP73989.1 Protein LacX, plasmid [Clostridium fungisolvens]